MSCMPECYVKRMSFYVQDSDVKAAQQASNLRFKGVPREGSLLNKSVIDTLYYCCLYHYDLGEVNKLFSIEKLS